MAMTNRQMHSAGDRAQERKHHIPQATGAAYHPDTGLVCIQLSNCLLYTSRCV